MCRERGLAPRGSGEDACGCVILVVLRLDLKFGEATTVPQSSLAPTRVSKGARPFDSSQGRLRGTRWNRHCLQGSAWCQAKVLLMARIARPYPGCTCHSHS